MEDGKNRFYGFGDFRVDTRRRILSRNGETISLSPRNFDLLLFMIQNEGQVLSHDDLLDKVWEGTFVEQANLKNAISVLRKTLGEGPNESFFIRTIPRRGYSFVAPIEVFADEKLTSVEYAIQETEVIVEESWEVDDARDDTELKQVEGSTKRSKSRSFLHSKVLILAAGLILVVGFVFGARTLMSGAGPIILEASDIRISKITTEGNLTGGGSSVSPSGKFIVYPLREGENVSIWTRQLATNISRQITPVLKGAIWACALTPDEDFIYYIISDSEDNSRSGLYKISTFGGGPQRISTNSGGSLTISPDGKRLAVTHLSPDNVTTIETMNGDGSDLKVVWSRVTDVRVWDLRFASDGATILAAIRITENDKARSYVSEFPADGGEEKIILPPQEKQLASAIWMPDRRSIILSVREVNAEVRQIWQYFPATTEWRRVTNDNSSYRGFSLTADGKMLVTTQDSRLTSLWASPSGRTEDITQVISGTHYLIDAGFTNDGRIVVAGVENSREQLSIMNLDGAGLRPLTSGTDGIWLFPDVSRGGNKILFASNRSGKRQIWSIDNDGSNAALVSVNTNEGVNAHMLSDGVTFLTLENISVRIASLFLNKSNGERVRLTEDQSRLWAVSPDEKMFAAQQEDEKTKRDFVAIRNLENGDLITKLDISPGRVMRWTPDGKAIAYDAIDLRDGKIMIQPIDGKVASTFLTLRSEDIFSFDWAPGGRGFVLIRGKHLTDAVKITVDPKP